jgi:hypothetical protein
MGHHRAIEFQSSAEMGAKLVAPEVAEEDGDPRARMLSLGPANAGDAVPRKRCAGEAPRATIGELSSQDL